MLTAGFDVLDEWLLDNGARLKPGRRVAIPKILDDPEAILSLRATHAIQQIDIAEVVGLVGPLYPSQRPTERVKDAPLSA